MISIDSVVIINFPLICWHSQQHHDVKWCPSVRLSLKSPAEECVSVCVQWHKEWTTQDCVLTAQGDDVAAVLMYKLLGHGFLHHLFHLHRKDTEGLGSSCTSTPLITRIIIIMILTT